MCLRVPALAMLLLSLACLTAGAGEVVINGVKVLGEQEQEPRDWSACRVKADLLQTGAGGTRTIASEERIVILGENLDFKGAYTLSNGQAQALVHMQVRLRASTVMEDGVMYLVTSEGELQAAVGYSPEETSRTQFRHDFIELDAGTAAPREVYVAPELGLRVLLVVSAQPVEDELEEPLIPSEERKELVRFRVEAKRRFDGRETTLQNAPLQAAFGHEASFGVVIQEPGEKVDEEETPEIDPEFPLGGRVRVVDLARKPDSGFQDDHSVSTRDVDDDYLARNTRQGDTSYIDDHTVELREAPIRSSMRLPKKKKLSKRKRRALKDSAEIRAARALALERSKTLAGGEGAPEPVPRAEQLQVVLTPLHGTARNLRLKLQLVGYMSLAGDEHPRAIDLSFTENVPWGQTLELGLREILEGGEPESDTIIAITPQP